MKLKNIAPVIVLVLVFSLAASGAALAMSSGNHSLPWTVLSGGGIEDGSSSGYIQGDTAGGPAAIGPSENNNYSPGSSLSYSVPVTVTVCLPADANGDGKIDSADLAKVLRIILGVDAPTCGADANRDDKIDSGDLVKVLRIILSLE